MCQSPSLLDFASLEFLFRLNLFDSNRFKFILLTLVKLTLVDQWYLNHYFYAAVN